MKAQIQLPNLLLVDDDEVDIMAVKRTLFRADAMPRLWVAGDGIEALAILRSGEIPHPRMVLLDLNMPRMNGIAFLRELRGDPSLEQEIVFVMSTSNAAEDRSAVGELNVRQYLVKDRIPDELVDLILKTTC